MVEDGRVCRECDEVSDLVRLFLLAANPSNNAMTTQLTAALIWRRVGYSAGDCESCDYETSLEEHLVYTIRRRTVVFLCVSSSPKK